MDNPMKMQGTVLTVVFVGIVLVIGLVIFAAMQTTMLAPNTAATSVNDTVTGAVTEAAAGQSFTTYYNKPSAACSNIVCINATGAGGTLTVPTSNYTVNNCNVRFSGAENTMGWNNTIWRCSYTVSYSETTASSNASSAMVISLSNGSAWLTIIVVVAFAVIVLGMLTSGLGKSAGGPSAGGEPGYTY